MKIFYVHHAQRDMGNSPSQNDKITELGKREAEIVGEEFLKLQNKLKIKAIYTSPYYRCVETARIINKYINVPVYEDRRLNEFNNVHNAVKGNKSDNKGESWLDCQLRIRDSIRDIVKKYKDDEMVFMCNKRGEYFSFYNSSL